MACRSTWVCSEAPSWVYYHLRLFLVNCLCYANGKTPYLTNKEVKTVLSDLENESVVMK